MYCINCGTELPSNAKFCFLCGKSQFDSDPQMNGDGNSPNLSDVNKLNELASMAENGKNFQQAYFYYTKAIEINPNDTSALLGKARCSLWKDDNRFASEKLSEALIYYQKAKSDKIENRDELWKTVHAVCWGVQATAKMSKNIYDPRVYDSKFDEIRKNREQHFLNFIERDVKSWITILSDAWKLFPSIELATPIYETLNAFREFNRPKIMSKEQQKRYEGYFQELIQEISSRFPNWNPPKPPKRDWTNLL